MPFDVQETLLAANLPSDVIPHMLWEELLAGTSKRRVFRNALTNTDRLSNDAGVKISVPMLTTRFSASTIGESTLDTTGYTATTPAVTDVDVIIGDQVYVAFYISDIIKEDQPNYDWIRVSLRDAGRAIAEYEDASIRDVLKNGALNVHPAAAAGTLGYDDVVDCLKLMKIDSWHNDDVMPYMILHPEQEADVLKDTRFINSHRYAVGNVADLAPSEEMTGVKGIYAGTRVMVSDNMEDYYALIVFPEHPRYGPVAIHAIKRPLTIRTQREEIKGRQLWVVSTRYGSSVIQGDGVGMISNC